MRIYINPLDPNSISEGVTSLRAYLKEFQKKEAEFVKRLAEYGITFASNGYALADYDGKNDITVRMTQQGTTAEVIAEGTVLGFIEFGTGVKFREWNNAGMEYTPPKHGTYGKGRGKNPKGWFFSTSKGSAQHTYGNPPAEVMRYTCEAISERITQIAREVWR